MLWHTVPGNLTRIINLSIGAFSLLLTVHKLVAREDGLYYAMVLNSEKTFHKSIWSCHYLGFRLAIPKNVHIMNAIRDFSRGELFTPIRELLSVLTK